MKNYNSSLITPVLVSLAIPISYYLYILNPKILDDFKKTNSPLYNFLLNKWYIDELYDLIFVNSAKKIGSFFWKKGDVGTIDRFGPDGISKLIKIISNKAGTTSGYSRYAYDIEGATQDGTIYPSMDYSIFEVKFPDNDIKGRTVNI